MTKKYYCPMLNVVSIRKSDIIATSTDAPVDTENTQNNSAALGAGRRFDSWDAGY